jgi:hypothetical protein
MNKRGCKVPGCKRKHRGLGYCANHYERFKSTGSPTKVHVNLSAIRVKSDSLRSVELPVGLETALYTIFGKLPVRNIEQG